MTMRYYHSWDYKVVKMPEQELVALKLHVNYKWAIMRFDVAAQAWLHFAPKLLYKTKKKAEEVAAVLETEPTISTQERYDRIDQQRPFIAEALVLRAGFEEEKKRHRHDAEDNWVTYRRNYKPRYCVTCAKMLPFPAVLCGNGHWVHTVAESSLHDAVTSIRAMTRRFIEARTTPGNSRDLFATLGDINNTHIFLPGFVAGMNA